jgi:FkbM family methyltransferase
MLESSALVKLAGVKIPLGDHLTEEIQDYIRSGWYEWPELRALKRRLTPDDVVLELGAGIGLLSTYCAKVAGSRRVFTYEANPYLEKHIREIYQLNDVAPRLRMCILGERDGAQAFYIQEAIWGSSTTPGDEAAKLVRVPIRRFNRVAVRIKPTFLVVDIEGGEYELSRHMRLDGVRAVLIEVHRQKLGQAKAEEILAVFSRSGFRVNKRLSAWEVVFLERQ